MFSEPDEILEKLNYLKVQTLKLASDIAMNAHLQEEYNQLYQLVKNTEASLDALNIRDSKVELPEPDGPIVTITEKLYVPVRQFPEYNFVGRILGPRGMTAKQLEQETGCRIMVRGKGSMKDKRKEESHRGRPNWEHLEDDLHVLIQCEDTEYRCRVKLAGAMQHVSRLLIPAPDGTDELKRKQLMELAIINGTYRPYHRASAGSPKSPHSPMLPLFNTPSNFSTLF